MEEFENIVLTSEEINTIKEIAESWHIDYEEVEEEDIVYTLGMKLDFLTTIINDNDTTNWDFKSLYIFARINKLAGLMIDIKEEAEQVIKILGKDEVF